MQTRIEAFRIGDSRGLFSHQVDPISGKCHELLLYSRRIGCAKPLTELEVLQ